MGRQKIKSERSKSKSERAGQILLLPDELCLVEDREVTLNVDVECRNYTFLRELKVEAYLTNYRVQTQESRGLCPGRVHTLFRRVRRIFHMSSGH
jgi:hypothetical protein